MAPGFRRRLAVYLMGVAIGLMLLGLFAQARSAAARRQQAAARPGQVEGPGASSAQTPGDAGNESTPRPSDEHDG